MENNKNYLTNFNTIVTVIVSVITAYTAYRTSDLNDKINNLKAVTEEGKTVSELIDKFSSSETPPQTFDFSFLSLERYLRNTTKDGSLKPQDKAMLIGFAKSIIYNRAFDSQKVTENIRNKILIPIKFLQDNDTLGFKELQIALNENNNVNMPLVKITKKDSLFKFQPISTTLDSIKAKTISLISGKTIYIQFSNNAKKDIAISTQKKLKSKSWFVPGIENVKGEYKNTIRYFHDADYSIAKEANEILEDKFELVRVYNFESKVPNGQIEIWINNN